MSSALSSACDFKSFLQTVWTQIRLLLKEQSDQCPYCLPVCKNRFEKSARIFSRRHKQTTFSDNDFLGALRVKYGKSSAGKYVFLVMLTICIALIVVSSMDAAWQPSSVEPPSHIPANAAILLLNKEKKNIIKVLIALVGRLSECRLRKWS